MQFETAEIIALQVFTYIASDEDLFRQFLHQYGVEEIDLKQQLSETDFQIAILDFLAQSDEWIEKVCARVGIAPQAIMEARNCLAPEMDMS